MKKKYFGHYPALLGPFKTFNKHKTWVLTFEKAHQHQDDIYIYHIEM